MRSQHNWEEIFRKKYEDLVTLNQSKILDIKIPQWKNKIKKLLISDWPIPVQT